MTGPLALVGRADWHTEDQVDAELLAASRADEVLVIPTGAAYEQPDALIQAAEAHFQHLGAKVRPVMALDRTSAEDPSLAAWVRQAGFVYLAGGSSLHIRSTLMQTILWDALRAAWQAGAVVAGSSAGAAALCDPMVDPRGGAFTVGLGLVHQVAAIPQANTWSEEKLDRALRLAPDDVTVLGIPDGAAAVLTEGRWRSTGSASVTAWRAGEPIELTAIT